MSYVHNLYVFHYVVSDTLTYLCMTDKEFPRLSSFQFLEDIRNRFLATYGERAKTAIAFALNSDFRKVLAAQMDRYNSMQNRSGSDAKIERVKEEINQVKDVMIKNIDRVLEIGERIELLVEKSDDLDSSAFKFKKKCDIPQEQYVVEERQSNVHYRGCCAGHFLYYSDRSVRRFQLLKMQINARSSFSSFFTALLFSRLHWTLLVCSVTGRIVACQQRRVNLLL